MPDLSPDLTLDLFGSPRLRLRGAPVEIRSQKALALLVYLAVEGGAHRRDFLAGLLWPDYRQAAARTYLRQALHELTEVVGHDCFTASRETIALAAGLAWRSDVGDFRALLATGEPDGLRQAVALYTNDFLTGFSLPDCAEFEQWQLLEAESLRRQLAAALAAVMRGYIEEQAYPAALAVGRRRLALDGCDEAAHRDLMQLYVWMGRPSAALRQYEECKRALAAAWQSAPEAETQALYEAIRHKRLPPAPHRPSAESRVVAPPSGDLPSGDLPSGNLPPRVASFVGRERELARLGQGLAAARAGSGQMLFVIGGAGRGKTMLVQEFARAAQLAAGDLLVASGVCNAYTGIGDAYLPFRQILMALAGDGETAIESRGGLAPSQDARRLWQALPAILATLVEDAPDLLRAFVPLDRLQQRAAKLAPANVPWRQRLDVLAKGEARLQLEERQLFSQFSGALKAIAARHPLLLILEDLHWVDAASNSLLLHLSRSLGDSPILVVGSYRPDELNVGHGGERHPLAAILGEVKGRYGDIWLDLGAAAVGEGRAFVDAYLDTQPNLILDEQFRATLFRQTEGHPLFTVELLRDLQERGELRRDAAGFWVAGERVNWSTLPARVEGVIEQRIGRLEPSLQAMLAAASVEGELFTAEVIARVQRLEAYEVVQRLSQELDRQQRLVRIEAMEQVGQQRLSRYRFRHYLFQHYLYSRLTPSERAYLHEKVGVALEELYGEGAMTIAVQLAHHFEQAGLAEKAVAYLRQAGEQAQRISAQREAIQLLTRAVALLATLPSSKAHLEQELAIRIAAGYSLRMVKGVRAQEVGDMFGQAYALGRQVGGTRELLAALHGLYSFQPTLDAMRAMAVEMLELAEKQPDPIYRVSAQHVVGQNLMEMNDYSRARFYLEQSAALYDPRQHLDFLAICGQDEGIAAMANLSCCLWYLGYPDQALQRSQEAVAIAEELAHPMSFVIAKRFEARVHFLRGELAEALQQTDLVMELAHKYSFGFVWALSLDHKGEILARQGQAAAAIHYFEEAIETWRAMTNPRNEPYSRVRLADAYRRNGEIERGLALINEVEPIIGTPPETSGQPNVARIKGELLFAQAMRAEKETEKAGAASANGQDAGTLLERAEAAFWQAIQVSRQQQAKSLELRATLGLCRLWQHQGKREEARRLLAAIYEWFTEGLETADLREARAFLAELSAGTRHLTV